MDKAAPRQQAAQARGPAPSSQALAGMVKERLDDEALQHLHDQFFGKLRGNHSRTLALVKRFAKAGKSSESASAAFSRLGSFVPVP